MKDTPIQKAISEITAGEYLPAAELRWVTKILQSLLPYERECFVETYLTGVLGDAKSALLEDDDRKAAHDYFTNTFKTNPQGGGEL